VGAACALATSSPVEELNINTDANAMVALDFTTDPSVFLAFSVIPFVISVNLFRCYIQPMT
jgi:hypothetical protein